MTWLDWLLIAITVFGISTGAAVILGSVFAGCDIPQPASQRTLDFFADPGIAELLPDVTLDEYPDVTEDTPFDRIPLGFWR